MIKKILIISILTLIVTVGMYVYLDRESRTSTLYPVVKGPQSTSLPPPTSAVNLKEIPVSKILPTSYHVFQSFNNCGPAALSMALSHYGINISQQELGQKLRPYQNASGDNDDKSVTLEEVAVEGKNQGFIPYHRPNGNVQLVKQFIAHDMPVITRTWLKVDDDIGHYRVIKGYDENTSEFIQDDSLQGANLRYSYEAFDAIWKKFNYEYVVLVPKGKEDIARAILKEDVDEKHAWEKAVQNSKQELEKNPSDVDERFNLSVALYHVGKYQESVAEFEKVESRLPFRTLWYQIEPIKSYFELKDYDRVLSITENILNNHNRAFSELYIIRGDVYKAQGSVDAARAEYEKAVFYNQNLTAAKEALAKTQ